MLNELMQKCFGVWQNFYRLRES